MSAAKKKKLGNTTKYWMFTIRTAPQDKELIEKAAEHAGVSISSFMLQYALRAARRELAEIEKTTLSERDARAFFESMTNSPAPNAALKKAFKDYSKQVRK